MRVELYVRLHGFSPFIYSSRLSYILSTCKFATTILVDDDDPHVATLTCFWLLSINDGGSSGLPIHNMLVSELICPISFSECSPVILLLGIMYGDSICGSYEVGVVVEYFKFAYVRNERWRRPKGFKRTILNPALFSFKSLSRSQRRRTRTSSVRN